MKRYFTNRTPCQVSHEPPDIENLMKLNPKIKPFTNAVPSAVTKKVSRGLLEKHLFSIFVEKSLTKTSVRKNSTKLNNFSKKCGYFTSQKNLLYHNEYEKYEIGMNIIIFFFYCLTIPKNWKMRAPVH